MLELLAAGSVLVQGPQLPALPPIKRDPQIVYLDRTGQVLGVRGGRFGPPVDISRLPAYVPAAFVAIEDKRFYEHQGFDAVRIAGALVRDIGKGKAAQGASTLTQQLARNLFLSADKNLERKALELVYAIQLERTYSKSQILGLYLSRVYFGSGAYGLEAAARRYFDKPANRLTLREAAALAAVMKSPTEYNPADHPDKSAERTRLVLDAMVDMGAISPADRARAIAQPLKVYRQPATDGAEYFVDWVDGQARRMLNAAALAHDVYIDTTVQKDVEVAADQVIDATVERYRARGVQQAALVSLDGFGRIRAMVGGVNHRIAPFNRAVDAHRQAGSAWKPFVYLTALESGMTPDTPVVDEPVTIDGWSPSNYEPEFLGQTTLELALAHSVNTVAARVADQVGRPKIADTARRLGITTAINTDPAMALGTSLVTPLEMAQAYDAFANGGNRVQAYAIDRIRLDSGQVLFQHPAPTVTPAINNPALSDLNRMLRSVITQGTGVKGAIPGYDLAGKTGTTSDFKDAWFCGFTGGLTTVVWVGRDDATPMVKIAGATAPLDIWRGYMTTALKRLPSLAIPPGPQATPPDGQDPSAGVENGPEARVPSDESPRSP